MKLLRDSGLSRAFIDSVVSGFGGTLRWLFSGDPVPAMLCFFAPLFLFGIVAILFYPGPSAVPCMSAMASLATGATLGFLFGIPRQANGAADRPGSGNGATFRHNTNLSDVSDWLTKIIVGLGIAEFDTIRTWAFQIVRMFSKGMGGPAPIAFAAGIVGYFATFGFISGYILTQLVLPRALAMSAADIDRQVSATVRAELAPVKEGLEDAKGLATAAIGAVLDPDTIKPVDQLAQAMSSEGVELWHSDPNVGKFGGASHANDRVLSARVFPVSGSDGSLCHVQLSVTSEREDRPLATPVTFHLHPTFVPNAVEVVPADGIARLDRISFGAFTAGAVTDDGKTTLELDLATLADAPEKFRQT